MNILLSPDACHLIDFDRGRIMKGDWWQSRTLARLQRSFEKLASKHDPFHFDAFQWSLLMDGYQPGL
jgi:hypothetical protein